VMTNVLNDAKNKLSSKTMIILYLKKHRSWSFDQPPSLHLRDGWLYFWLVISYMFIDLSVKFFQSFLSPILNINHVSHLFAWHTKFKYLGTCNNISLVNGFTFVPSYYRSLNFRYQLQ
jgi:hypothetical protein